MKFEISARFFMDIPFYTVLKPTLDKKYWPQEGQGSAFTEMYFL